LGDWDWLRGEKTRRNCEKRGAAVPVETAEKRSDFRVSRIDIRFGHFYDIAVPTELNSPGARANRDAPDLAA
jgi:hypothetical protein